MLCRNFPGQRLLEHADAAAWAEQKGITGGIGNGLFGPHNNCTRAQIVTFLYRMYGSK